jgi:hypothetical protein
MSSHPFRPFRRDPSAPLFPKRVLNQLQKPKLPKVPPYEIHPGRYLIPFIDASGFSLEEISHRMQLPPSKTAITTQLIEKTLTSDDPEMWIISRLFKALKLDWEDFRVLQEKQRALHEEAHARYKQAKKLLLLYQGTGPRLHTLITYEAWFGCGIIIDSYHLTRQIHTGPKYSFILPTPEEMAQIIATTPEQYTHPLVHQLEMPAAYLYHRLPNELHLYNLQGQLIASGDTTLTIPKHLILI